MFKKECHPDKERNIKTGKCTLKRCEHSKKRNLDTGKCVTRNEPVLSRKQHALGEILSSTKQVLENLDINFHLHKETALGVHRDNKFISTDSEIDIGIFRDDINPEGISSLKKGMKREGFLIKSSKGKLESNLYIIFVKNRLELEVSIVYNKEYHDKQYYTITYGDKILAYSPYKVTEMNFMNEMYKVIPRKSLQEMYGEEWSTTRNLYYRNYMDLDRDVNKNIAFCFLLYDTVKHAGIWEEFFSQDTNPEKSWSIYTHPKMITEKTQDWVRKNKIKRIVKTEWCETSLVTAWINLLREALRDKKNQYFVLLSGDCIPLQNYQITYKGITSDPRSRFNIDPNADSAQATGLMYADQWSIVNIKHAEMMLDLKRTEDGKMFWKEIGGKLCVDDSCYCSDELYPINWMIDNFGKPGSKSFNKEILLQQTTYTKWDGVNPSPIRINGPKLIRLKKKICSSGAFFARKFNSKAARYIFDAC